MSALDDDAKVIVATMRCCASCGAHYRSDFVRCPSDGAEIREVAVDPLIGTRMLEPYVIEELLGEGSMGRVYRAHHSRLVTKRYAVKVLRGDLATAPAMRIRFAKEAELASKLDHPNVVTVHDFGRSKKGLLFIAMELVDGTSLTDLIAVSPIPVERAVAYARDIASGLAYAHDQGVIHRDLKPDNVLIVGGAARIVDFGIAISVDGNDARLTATGFTLGTPGYLSPESMIDGSVDHRTDLYGLGVTMFEMLTGELPFAGNAMNQMAAKATREAPALAERAPAISVPPAVDKIVGKLLARRPGARYQSAREVIDALDRVSSAAQATDRVPARRRSRAVAIVPVLAAVAVLAAIAFAVWPRLSPAPAETGPASLAPATASASLAPATASASLAPATAPASLAHATAPPALVPAPRSPPAPVVIRTSPPPPAPVVIRTPPAEPPAAVADDDADRDRARDRRHHAHTRRDRGTGDAPAPAPATAAAAAPAPGPAPASASASPAPTAAVATPSIATPVVLDARVAHVAVDGGLADQDVELALVRARPALRKCAASAHAPAVIEVHFKIGESRRPTDVTASGGTPATADCVAAAVRGIRSAAAPDVGNAAVRVDVALVERATR